MPPTGQRSCDCADIQDLPLSLSPALYNNNNSKSEMTASVKCVCADPGSLRRGEVCRTHGLRQTAVQTGWDQRDLQRHRTDSHERYDFTLIRS